MYTMEVDRIPNMTGLEIDHLIDPAPAGCKTEWIDFSKIDYNDKREVPLSWKRIKSFDEACEWYSKECDGKYPDEIIPYLVKKSIEPAMVKQKKKKKKRFGLIRTLGEFIVKFK